MKRWRRATKPEFRSRWCLGYRALWQLRQPLDVGLEYGPPDEDDPNGKLTGVAVQVDNIAAIVTRRSSVTPATTLWPIRSHVLRWTTLPVVNRLSDVTGG